MAFASYILCSNPQADDRCGQCPACKQLDQLAHPDLHFSYPFIKTDKIKTAAPHQRAFAEVMRKNPYTSLVEWELSLNGEKKKSVITADEGHEIIKSLSLKAFAKGHKVLIIWHAEKLNREAANRLLKTLEEPSPKTLIILVCSQIDDLLPTIRSRVQLVQCEPLSEKEISKALVEREGLDGPTAEALALRAEGSYQQALHLHLNSAAMGEQLERFSRWMRHTYKREFAEIFNLADAFSKQSRDQQQQFIEYALDFVHKCIMREFTPVGQAMFDKDAAAFAQKFAPYITGGDMQKLHDVLSEGHYLVERNVNAHLLFTRMSVDIMRYFADRKASVTN